MVRLRFWTAGLASLLMVMAAEAQDRSACTGIYCPQVKAADSAAELAPYIAAGKTWEQVKGQNTLVLKYYNRDGTLASTRTWPQSAYMQPVAGLPGKVAFAGQGTPTIALHGLAPCTRKGSFELQGRAVHLRELLAGSPERKPVCERRLSCAALTRIKSIRPSKRRLASAPTRAWGGERLVAS